MARSKVFDRARHVTTTTGTGTLTLGAAASGFATMAEAGIADGDTVTYLIENGNDFEIGRGIYTAAGTTLTRDTVLLSKISGTAGTSKINLSGTSNVSVVRSASDYDRGDLQFLCLAASDETTALTTGTNKATLPIPKAFRVTEVFAGLNTVSSSGAVTVDINEDGTTIISTKITIDANEKTSLTAATPPVISDANIAAGAEIGIDIDGAGTGAKGLKVWIIGYWEP